MDGSIRKGFLMNTDQAAITPAQKQQKSIQFALGEVFQRFMGMPSTNTVMRRFYDALSRTIREKNLPVKLLGFARVRRIVIGSKAVGYAVPVEINGVEQVVVLRSDLAANGLKKALAPTASAPSAA
ncbi:hypothetical protein [Burkholderia multivorans]|uniref:hypothetical protein n=1 Tax=Burkholderia multivorans TaxID=87883 RepID=UPI0011B26787|nr:hypothetical protein [Burkholderia multivorans]